MNLNKKSLSIEARVGTIEKLLFFLFLFVGSFIILTKPELNKLGKAGIIFYFVIFLISYLLICLYFGFLIAAISVDYSRSLTFFLEKNKKWVGYPIVIIIAVLAGLILEYFGYDLKQYIGEIIIAVIIYMIIGIQQIVKWIENMKWDK